MTKQGDFLDPGGKKRNQKSTTTSQAETKRDNIHDKADVAIDKNTDEITRSGGSVKKKKSCWQTFKSFFVITKEGATPINWKVLLLVVVALVSV